MIQYIASDLDGTLLNNDSAVSEENLTAIRQLRKKGILTVPVTGRTYMEIPAAVREEECITHFIFSNGAGIFEKGKGVIYASSIPKKTATTICTLLSSYQTFIEIYSGGFPWAEADKLTEESFDYYRINPRFRKIIRNSRKKADNFQQMLENGSLKPELFDAFFRYEDERAECFEKINKLFPETETVSSLGNNIEIMNSGTNKGTSLHRLCEILCIDTAETLAAGDSKNDIDLLKAAGFACAVSNACDEVKALADKIICSNNEHIMKHIEENILC